ncbi:hypothetical protein SE17_25110 [Kouleothrix aurantiaca]|uniref:Smr domain-containing protein n=1 Tax=Kouleothrix aurantiaca TaxID=186479 RepID=A0A0N8PRS6_9CHLR|nr:hypothetical protein SE17_25110 [Kouleothrix aurantiaca]
MDTLERLLAGLVAIDSVNPALVAGGAGEGAIAAFVAEWLRAAGLEVQLDEVRPGRPNVVARLRGSGGGHTLLLNGHIDTVGVAGMAAPHQPGGNFLNKRCRRFARVLRVRRGEHTNIQRSHNNSYGAIAATPP